MIASKYAKRDMMESEFTQRASRIAVHGLGLSVDVYSPDLLHLVQVLRDGGLRPGYLEVFKAAISALQWVRRHLQDMKLPYHGEGLWTTQPDFSHSSSGRQGVAEACAQIAVLDSAWLNHECATKQMAGYAFGTYLPPLYTDLSARMTAENLNLLQAQVDEQARHHGTKPALVLLEMPPLTYFGCGSLAIPAFFRTVTEHVACGLVLDIGHLWTVYRYTGAWRRQTVGAFTAEFLDVFPMERVIEIHVAGLAEFTPHDDFRQAAEDAGLPYWIDAHGSPIPEVLFDLLAQVLEHPRLTSLKGVALEVDTKPVATIVTEFRRFCDRFETLAGGVEQAGQSASLRWPRPEMVPYAESRRPLTSAEQATLSRQYQAYVRFVSGRPSQPSVSMTEEPTLLGGSLDDLNRYREIYLPYELLHWGGELQDMFPKTCRMLAETLLPLERFVPFWFSRPRSEENDYDFFLLKIDRFVEFVANDCPAAAGMVMEEAQELRTAYRAANEPVESAEVRA
ncbi:MAG: DUF692 family protein [Nitrospira sp.]|nr:DUF692 family protein [Nitrospira sp.]